MLKTNDVCHLLQMSHHWILRMIQLIKIKYISKYENL